MALSDTWLKANSGKARAALEERGDRDGMGVRATPIGKITFQLRYRYHGAPKRLERPHKDFLAGLAWVVGQRRADAMSSGGILLGYGTGCRRRNRLLSPRGTSSMKVLKKLSMDTSRC